MVRTTAASTTAVCDLPGVHPPPSTRHFVVCLLTFFKASSPPPFPPAHHPRFCAVHAVPRRAPQHRESQAYLTTCSATVATQRSSNAGVHASAASSMLYDNMRKERCRSSAVEVVHASQARKASSPLPVGSVTGSARQPSRLATVQPGSP